MTEERLITLDNMHEPFAQASRYVLTSPRSLRACAVHNVKVGPMFSNDSSCFGNYHRCVLAD